MKKKIIFVVQAFSEKTATGSLEDVVILELFAKNENEAIEKAKTYIKRDGYRVSSIIEKD